MCFFCQKNVCFLKIFEDCFMFFYYFFDFSSRSRHSNLVKNIIFFVFFRQKSQLESAKKSQKKSPKFEDFLQHGKPCILRGKSTNDIGVGTHFCVILDLSYGEKSDTF